MSMLLHGFVKYILYLEEKLQLLQKIQNITAIEQNMLQSRKRVRVVTDQEKVNFFSSVNFNLFRNDILRNIFRYIIRELLTPTIRDAR